MGLQSEFQAQLSPEPTHLDLLLLKTAERKRAEIDLEEAIRFLVKALQEKNKLVT